jgi:hypothetical protein
VEGRRRAGKGKKEIGWMEGSKRLSGRKKGWVEGSRRESEREMRVCGGKRRVSESVEGEGVEGKRRVN